MVDKEPKELSAEDRLLASILGEKRVPREPGEGAIEGWTPSPMDQILEETGFVDKTEKVSHAHLKEQMEEVLSSTTDLERKVLRLRYGLDDGRARTQAEVGEEIGRSRWAVGRIQRKALQKLRNPHRSEKLQEYLG